uniref:SH2 domain-containing protein n=1 Tax=Romanomermis culicivorax TaxID=13658 RepID=A0A915LEF6_ROMCU
MRNAGHPVAAHLTIEENLRLLLERRALYFEFKEKIESRIKTLKLDQETAGRRLAAVKPDLVPLHKRREALQRLLEAIGLNDEVVAKILDAQNEPDKNLRPPATLESNSGPARSENRPDLPEAGAGEPKLIRLTKNTSFKNGFVARDLCQMAKTSRKSGIMAVVKKSPPKLGSDYIPPQSVLEVVDHWLMKPSSSKQEAFNLLMENNEKFGDGKKIKIAKDGTFLIRPSETKHGFYALSVVCKQKIQNCMIEKKISEPKFNAEDQSPASSAQQRYSFGFEGTENYFACLSDLVKYYSRNSLKSHNPDLDVTLMHPALLNRSKQ